MFLPPTECYFIFFFGVFVCVCVCVCACQEKNEGSRSASPNSECCWFSGAVLGQHLIFRRAASAGQRGLYELSSVTDRPLPPTPWQTYWTSVNQMLLVDVITWCSAASALTSVLVESPHESWIRVFNHTLRMFYSCCLRDCETLCIQAGTPRFQSNEKFIQSLWKSSWSHPFWAKQAHCDKHSVCTRCTKCAVGKDFAAEGMMSIISVTRFDSWYFLGFPGGSRSRGVVGVTRGGGVSAGRSPSVGLFQTKSTWH